MLEKIVMNNTIKTYTLLIICFLTVSFLTAQVRVLDDFNSVDGWNEIKSDGVTMDIAVDKGHTGNAVRFDYDFTKGTGYAGIQKMFPLVLPDNYEVSFWIKAVSPANNLEVKFLDKSGDNVWWKIFRNYNFPTEWTKIKLKKRHLEFAWGPSGGTPPTRFDRIEFTVSSVVGGKGSVWIDDLKFEPLPAETDTYPTPEVKVSSKAKGISLINILTDSAATNWESKNSKPQTITYDLKQRREFGGLQIDWTKNYSAKSFKIYTSQDSKTWDKIKTITDNQSNTSFIRIGDGDARYIKLVLLSANNAKHFGINEIKIIPIKDGETPNDFYLYCAANSPKGDYPRYFTKQASYWTVTGVNNDVKEALINEDGMVEVDKNTFSIEPMIKLENKLYNWSNANATQTMGSSSNLSDLQHIPTVHWDLKDITFSTAVASGGKANVSSDLYVKYGFKNNTTSDKKLEFYLLLRPFQVNPYYQFLNQPGGVGKINKIEEIGNQLINVDNKSITSQIPFQQLSTYDANQGNLVELINDNQLNGQTQIADNADLASGVIKYELIIPALGEKEFIVKVPYYQQITSSDFSSKNWNNEFNSSVDFWTKETNHIQFNLPASADRIVDTYKTQLVDILINKDNYGFQPGSRSYERSWIRDGALTSSALLKSGIVKEVKEFIEWYSNYLYEDGKVPCVVDSRGPDPVPENDSHGQFIYLIREYFNFTQDTALLRQMNPKVIMAVNYMQKLINEQTTDHFKYGNDSIHSMYGLVTESISHEGYSAKPMHSYWDDFFTMKGLKDAVDIQHILGNTAEEKRIEAIRDTFKVNLYNSISLAMKYKGIDYIPGCAELGDFDATSTTVALSPINELDNLPKPQIYNTFDKYYDYFTKRKNNTIDWINYTPYENRVIGSFIMLNQPERAHDLIEYFLKDQRPQDWYQWAEVVWKDYRTPKFIGDMPHTWVGSDFLNSIRSMFVYENEYDDALVLAAALYQDWIDSPNGMSVSHLPTYYGEVSYSIKKDGNTYNFNITGNLKLPSNGIKIQNFNGSKLPKKVTVNGKQIKTFINKYIQIMQSPANVAIEY